MNSTSLITLIGMIAMLDVSAQSAPETEAYVYVEPFELRLEVVVAANRLTPPSNNEIDTSIRQQLLERWTSELAAAAELTADGKVVSFELDRIEFVRPSPKGFVPDERDLVPIEDAKIGAVFVHSRDDYPDQLDLTWKLFPLIGDEPVSLKFEAAQGSEIFQKEISISKNAASQSWTLPEALVAPTLASAEVAPQSNWLKTGAWGLLFAALVFVFIGLSREFPSFRIGASVLASLSALVGILMLVFAKMEFDDARAKASPNEEEIVHSLLGNIYHAFDYRQETRIYDTLATSVDGELLEKLYLDIRSGLVVEEEGGPRVRVGKVRLHDCEASTEGETIKADAQWTAFGSVSHWGHLHQRRNRYHALLNIQPRDGRWKIVEIEILEEARN